jgi:hypothetical protein
MVVVSIQHHIETRIRQLEDIEIFDRLLYLKGRHGRKCSRSGLLLVFLEC